MIQRQKFLGLVAIIIAVIVAIILVDTAITWAQGPGGNPNCPGYGPNGTGGYGYHGGMMRGGMMQGRGHHSGMMMGNMMGQDGCPMMGAMPQGMMQGHPMWQNFGTDGLPVGQGNMMGAWTPPADLAPVAGAALDLDSAVNIAEAYIGSWQNTNLTLGEVIQFDNHFYAQAMEIDTGRGAFEFLIDPATGNVYLEPGPNRMWNLRYGMYGGRGYGMMAGATTPNDGVEMSITPERARELAQQFLTAYGSDLTVGEEAEAFYGYYTLEILQNGQISGMLSVNGYTGQVWLHHWHGQFIAITGADE